MNNNKTPGPDGISADFYKVFWSSIRKPIFRVIDHAFSNDQLSSKIKVGILNLIPKNGKDTRYLKNLRPITVLNTDYQLIEKCISNRLKPCLKEIIHSDQTGFMSERRISTNIRKLYDIMLLSEERDEANIILSCDFVKCFDRCEFECITKSMQYFKIPDILVRWVRMLYEDFTIRIQQNGYFSDNISVTRSIHQGGCCSAELFIICAEPSQSCYVDLKRLKV